MKTWMQRIRQRWDARRPVVVPVVSAGPAPGWYRDQERADLLRYWDGKRWTDDTMPVPTQRPDSPPRGAAQPVVTSQPVVALVLAGAVIGLLMSMQSASLLTGTGALWTGAGIACAAAVAAGVMRAYVPVMVRGLVVVIAILAVVSVLYVEDQMAEKRQEISEIWD